MASLSVREREVMGLVVDGMLNKQAAAALGISEVTVKVHRRRVMQKTGAHSLPELVRMSERVRLPATDNFGALHQSAMVATHRRS
jgi:FixJ family two-component response regulator